MASLTDPLAPTGSSSYGGDFGSNNGITSQLAANQNSLTGAASPTYAVNAALANPGYQAKQLALDYQGGTYDQNMMQLATQSTAAQQAALMAQMGQTGAGNAQQQQIYQNDIAGNTRQMGYAQSLYGLAANAYNSKNSQLDVQQATNELRHQLSTQYFGQMGGYYGQQQQQQDALAALNQQMAQRQALSQATGNGATMSAGLGSTYGELAKQYGFATAKDLLDYQQNMSQLGQQQNQEENARFGYKDTVANLLDQRTTNQDAYSRAGLSNTETQAALKQANDNLALEAKKLGITSGAAANAIQKGLDALGISSQVTMQNLLMQSINDNASSAAYKQSIIDQALKAYSATQGPGADVAALKAQSPYGNAGGFTVPGATSASAKPSGGSGFLDNLGKMFG